MYRLNQNDQLSWTVVLIRVTEIQDQDLIQYRLSENISSCDIVHIWQKKLLV